MEKTMPSVLDCLLRRLESILYGTVLVVTAAIGDDDASDHDPLASPLGVSPGRAWSKKPPALSRAS
jgi:hypothetical protein